MESATTKAATSPRARKLRAREVWLRVHRYLGLGLGGLAALVSLTGTLLVYNDVWIQLEHATVFERLTPGPPGPVDAWIAGTAARYPDLANESPFVVPPHAPYRWFGTPAALLIYESEASGKSAREAHEFVLVDPATGEPLERFVFEEGWSGLPFVLHSTLLMPFGREVLTVLALFILVSLFSGLWLWWPGVHRILAGLRIRFGCGALALTRDLHMVTAVALLMPLVVLTVTGLYYVQPGWFAPLDRLSAPEVPQAGAERLPPAPLAACAGAISLAEAVDVAQDARPRLAVAALYFDHLADGDATLLMTAPNRWAFRAPLEEVIVDRRCGIVREGALQRSPLEWLAPLHSGETFGLVGYTVTALTGIGLALLFVTGVIMWLMRRARRALR